MPYLSWTSLILGWNPWPRWKMARRRHELLWRRLQSQFIEGSCQAFQRRQGKAHPIHWQVTSQIVFQTQKITHKKSPSLLIPATTSYSPIRLMSSFTNSRKPAPIFCSGQSYTAGQTRQWSMCTQRLPSIYRDSWILDCSSVMRLISMPFSPNP